MWFHSNEKYATTMTKYKLIYIYTLLRFLETFGPNL